MDWLHHLATNNMYDDEAYEKVDKVCEDVVGHPKVCYMLPHKIVYKCQRLFHLVLPDEQKVLVHSCHTSWVIHKCINF